MLRGGRGGCHPVGRVDVLDLLWLKDLSVRSGAAPVTGRAEASGSGYRSAADNTYRQDLIAMAFGGRQRTR